MLRGSRDFSSLDEYTCFIKKVVDRRNRLVQEKLEQERPHLQLLPPAPVPESGPGAQVEHHPGGWPHLHRSLTAHQEVQIRLYAGHLEVYYKGHLVERMERVRGEREARVDYRHVIGSLVRKPGAFSRYRFREQMFPTMTFRLAYDALREWRGERADVEYVRILHLAATTMECTVDSALALLLEAGGPFDYAGQGAGQAHAATGAGTQPARSTGPGSMTPCWRRWPDDGYSGDQRPDRGAVRLPTMGKQSVARFTAAGHGAAGDPAGGAGAGGRGPQAAAHRQAAHRVQAARARPGRPSNTTGCPWRSGSNWTNWAAEASWTGASTCWPSDCPAPARPTPLRRGTPAGGVGTLGALRPGLPSGAGPPRRQAGPVPAQATGKLDSYDFLLLDDLGYLPQVAEESEVLFTLIAERYERRSLGITSNLVFSQWEHIFANPMARVVHHSVILEFDVPSYRTAVAQQRGQNKEVNRQD